MGARGQFDVMLGDELVASKDRRGVLAWLLRGGQGFPEADDVIAALRDRLERRAGV